MSLQKGQVSRESLAWDGHRVVLTEGDGIVVRASWLRGRPFIFLINWLCKKN